MLIALPCIVLGILSFVAPDKYKKLTKRCRKKVKVLNAEDGRGPVGDQLRAILAMEAEKSDVFRAWDKNGGGSVSRKEFRLWWPRIGYDAPTEDINDLFDEFDADGSGEVDDDEFRIAFEKQGKLWLELGQLQKEADQNDAVHKLIAAVEATINKKKKERAKQEATVSRLEEKKQAKLPVVEKTATEIEEVSDDLNEHKRKLMALKGGFKRQLTKQKTVAAFMSAKTPDEAAIAIQSRVRGRTAHREVQTKILERKAAEAAALANDPHRRLLARTAAFVQEREISMRLQQMRDQVKMMKLVSDAVDAERERAQELEGAKRAHG